MNTPCKGDGFESVLMEDWRRLDRKKPASPFYWTTRRSGCNGCAKAVVNGGKCGECEP